MVFLCRHSRGGHVQDAKDSNPRLRFWRPPCFRCTSILLLTPGLHHPSRWLASRAANASLSHPLRHRPSERPLSSGDSDLGRTSGYHPICLYYSGQHRHAMQRIMLGPLQHVNELSSGIYLLAWRLTMMSATSSARHSD